MSPVARHAHGLCMPEEARLDALRRLKTVRGHLDGIVRMLEDPHVYCVDVMRQVKATLGGLRKTNDVVLEGHLKNHVTTAHERDDAERIVKELMDAIKYG